MLLNPDAGYFVLAAYVDERRYRLAALGYGLEEARMKTAARRWIQGARDFALQDDALTRFFNEGGQQSARRRGWPWYKVYA